MIKRPDTKGQRIKRHARVRGKISGTAERPRLSVFRSENNIYAQIIDDVAGKTICAASTVEKGFEGQGGNKEAAKKIGQLIAQRAAEKGYIKNFQIIDDGTQGIIRITLKYLPGKEKAIQGLRRVSKPGLRVYAGADELPKVLKGLGIAIISTSRGVMTDKEARKLHVGGEVLAFVW